MVRFALLTKDVTWPPTPTRRIVSCRLHALSFIPIVLSLLVLAAHFLRGSGLLVASAVVALLLLLAVRRPWAARILQLVLILGALEWIRTLVSLAIRRSQHGEPFMRMVAILGVVVAITLVSALLFETPRLRRIYGLTTSQPD